MGAAVGIALRLRAPSHVPAQSSLGVVDTGSAWPWDTFWLLGEQRDDLAWRRATRTAVFAA
jgi:hypothetical protein